MSIQFYPFDSQVNEYTEDGLPIYDRPADSSLLRRVYTNYFYDGVLIPYSADSFKVTAASGMTLSRAAGAAIIQGAIMMDEAAGTITIDAADTLPRIDRIVARLNDDINVRAMSVEVLKGTPSAQPTAPNVTRTATIYELVLADVAVPANVSQLTNANITDRRPDPVLCGISGARVTADQIRQSLDDDQVRHITMGTADMVAGTTPLNTGSIYLCYDE